MYHRKDPTRIECLAVLGLTPGATWRQIKRAYRRLALRYHPDRCVWRMDPNDHHIKFCQVTQAYAVLQRSARPMNRPCALGRCRRCGDMETLQQGLDGNNYCRACRTHAGGKRMLPGPPPVWVRLGPILIGLLASACALITWLVTGQQPYWWLGMGLAAASMAALAGLCMMVRYVAPSMSARISPISRSRRSAGPKLRSRHRRYRWLRTALNT